VSAQDQAPQLDEDAQTILTAMKDYLAGLQTFSAHFEADVDVVTFDGEKLKFTSSGELVVERPDKLHVKRHGAFVASEFIVDGTNLSIYVEALEGYIQFPATSIDEAVVVLRDNTGFEAPGADLLLSDPLNTEATDIKSGAHVGMATIDGVLTHHLAFRNAQVDWQLWVQDGDQPLPVKYVITSKWVTGAPEYVLNLSNWNLSPSIDPALFTFTPPEGAKELPSIEVDVTGLSGVGGQ
jgi:hypothetical protein